MQNQLHNEYLYEQSGAGLDGAWNALMVDVNKIKIIVEYLMSTLELNKQTF